jgi:hypothetical protein
LPDAVAQATLSAVAPTAGAPTDEPTAQAIAVDATLPAVADANANAAKMGLAASSRDAVANTSNNLSAQLVPAQQVT